MPDAAILSESAVSACELPESSQAHGRPTRAVLWDSADYRQIEFDKLLRKPVQEEELALQEEELTAHSAIFVLFALSDVPEEIGEQLRADRLEAELHGELGPTPAAIATCRRIAIQIAQWLNAAPHLTWAVFGEDEGAAVLVVRSDSPRRRVDYRISSGGQEIVAILIDETLRVERRELDIEDTRSIRECAAWLTTPP